MYPKWVQRAPEIGAVLCLNEAEERQLLDDWATRNDAPAPQAAEETKESLQAKLDAAGISYDARWGLKRLQEALAG